MKTRIMYGLERSAMIGAESQVIQGLSESMSSADRPLAASIATG